MFYINNNETYIKKLKRCYVGEEFFFQNIFMNTKWKDKVAGLLHDIGHYPLSHVCELDHLKAFVFL